MEFVRQVSHADLRVRVVAHLANLSALNGWDVEEERRLILTQIAIFRDWEQRRNLPGAET
jgi:hypothetical protein